MFDLKKNISLWKQSLSNNESFTDENSDELENHLTEQIDSLKESGLSDEESFWVAQKRMGSIASLNTEYEKVNYLDIIRKRTFWMLFGFAAFALALFSMSAFSYFSYALIKIADVKLVTLTYLTYSVQEVLFLIPIVLIMWIMSGRNSELLERLVMSFMNRIDRKWIGIMGVLVLVLSLLSNYLWGNGLQSINIAISHAEGYREYMEMKRSIEPVIMIINSMIIFMLFFFSFKKTYNSPKTITN